jgi:hypothetical protein
MNRWITPSMIARSRSVFENGAGHSIVRLVANPVALDCHGIDDQADPGSELSHQRRVPVHLQAGPGDVCRARDGGNQNCKPVPDSVIAPGRYVA